MSEPRDLALIDKARTALAEARTIEEAKDLRDKAGALAYYAARKGGAEEAERYANEIRLRAERKIGELSAQMEKAKPGGAIEGKRGGSRPIESATAAPSKVAALEAAGIRKEDASRFERMAAIPEKRFDAEVVKPEATTRTLARIGGEYRKPATKRSNEPVKVARPPVSDRVIEQLVRRFRAQVERLTRREIERWPTGASKAPLVRALNEVANELQEA